MKVNDLVEKMHDPEDLSKFATEGLSRYCLSLND